MLDPKICRSYISLQARVGSLKKIEDLARRRLALVANDGSAGRERQPDASYQLSLSLPPASANAELAADMPD
jgi:hypothetical protein